MRTKLKFIGSLGQWIGLIASTTGVVLLCIYIVNPASIFISAGSLVWGIGTKLKYYNGLRAIEKARGKKISIDQLLEEHNIIPVKREN